MWSVGLLRQKIIFDINITIDFSEYTNEYIFSLLFPKMLVQKLCKKIFCILGVKIGDLPQNVNISNF